MMILFWLFVYCFCQECTATLGHTLYSITQYSLPWKQTNAFTIQKNRHISLAVLSFCWNHDVAAYCLLCSGLSFAAMIHRQISGWHELSSRDSRSQTAYLATDCERADKRVSEQEAPRQLKGWICVCRCYLGRLERDGEPNREARWRETGGRRELRIKRIKRKAGEDGEKGKGQRMRKAGFAVPGKGYKSVHMCVSVCTCLFSLQCEGGRQIDHMDKSRRWPGCAKNQLVLPHCVVWQDA